MDLETVKNFMGRWMDGTGPDAEIVLSSRARLARNIKDIPFPYLAADSQTEKVLKLADDAILKEKNNFKKFHRLVMTELPSLERQVLVEKHLISPLMVKESHNSAVYLKEDETISIMVNEEDHLRIQSLLPGLQLHKCWEEVNNVDDLLEKNLKFAYDEKKGYLTACPTNVGTGFRLSVMIHLPALVMTKQINRILAAVSKLGLAVRGIYGEGSEVIGNLFQISNQITLGLSEEEIISNLHGVTRQIIDQEQHARQSLLDSNREKLADRAGRAFGVLSHSRVIDTKESMQLLSDIRLGLDLGLLEEADRKVLNQLLFLIRPACLQKQLGRELDPEERDQYRAALIRRCIKD